MFPSVIKIHRITMEWKTIHCEKDLFPSKSIVSSGEVSKALPCMMIINEKT